MSTQKTDCYQGERERELTEEIILPFLLFMSIYWCLVTGQHWYAIICMHHVTTLVGHVTSVILVLILCAGGVL